MQEIKHLLQRHYGAALSILMARIGDISLAEDAMQEAAIKALELWQETVPDKPRAWLITVAYRYSVDQFRRHNKLHQIIAAEAHTIDLLANTEGPELEDHLLQLIFICCHPSIQVENQIALTLKLVMGFHVLDIARALVVPESTVEQRITRAKRKIQKAGIEFELPNQHQLKQRLPSVLKTLYLIFNEGHHRTRGDRLYCELRCQQAIRLMRSLCRLFRGNSEALALLALMLFTDARLPGRGQSQFIPLEDQDRSLWRHAQIAQADIILQKSLAMKVLSPYHIEAAISGLHSQAKTFSATDWLQIKGLYQKLYQYKPTPIVQLNLASAHLMDGDIDAAHSLLARLEPELSQYAGFHAAFAKLLEQQQDPEGAKRHFLKAARLSKNEQDIAYFLKLAEC